MRDGPDQQRAAFMVRHGLERGRLHVIGNLAQFLVVGVQQLVERLNGLAPRGVITIRDRREQGIKFLAGSLGRDGCGLRALGTAARALDTAKGGSWRGDRCFTCWGGLNESAEMSLRARKFQPPEDRRWDAMPG